MVMAYVGVHSHIVSQCNYSVGGSLLYLEVLYTHTRNYMCILCESNLSLCIQVAKLLG